MIATLNQYNPVIYTKYCNQLFIVYNYFYNNIYL